MNKEWSGFHKTKRTWIRKKIKELNKTMPHYKSIKGILVTQEPLIKTTTNKIKRQNNLEQIRKEEAMCN